jgi:hypothetical protein
MTGAVGEPIWSWGVSGTSVILPDEGLAPRAHYSAVVRISDFWKRMEARFGATYARSLAADYRVSALDGTVNEALERGMAPKVVWRAVCDEFQVAPQHR